MHVDVDRAGQHVQPAGIERFGSGWHGIGRADRQDAAVADGDAGRHDASPDGRCGRYE